MLDSGEFSNEWGTFKEQLADLINEQIITSKTQISKSDIGTSGIELTKLESTAYVNNVLKYCLKIPIAGVTKDYYPFVSFNNAAIELGVFNNAWVETYNGGVYIYTQEDPQKIVSYDYVMINVIKCIK